MGGAAHGFVRPPPRLATKTMTMATSTGGPADSLLRLHAHRQARATARDNKDEDEDEDEDNHVQRAMKALAAGDIRATRCAGGRQPATQSSMITGQQATTKRAADKSTQQPTIAR